MFVKEKIKDLHYTIAGEIKAADVNIAADEILASQTKDAKIPGFRPGHVPMNVLRQKFGDNAYAQAADKLINADMAKFIADKKIKLAGSPRADIAEFKTGDDVKFTLEFDILPALPKIELEKFTVTEKIAKVDKKDVDAALENLRKSRAQFDKQAADYKIANGDIAVIDFKGFVGDDAFEGGEAKKHNLTIGSGQFIPGFEEQLVGHAAGDKFDVNVKFPADYHANLAGKDARFEIVVHEVRSPKMPALDDQLAKDVGQENLAALTAHVEKILSDKNANDAQREMRNELLGIMADKVKMDLPETLVVQEMEMAKREHEHHNEHNGHDHKWDEKKERAEAERRVKLGLILAEWGEQNKVTVTQEDLQQAIWQEAAQYPDPQQVFAFYNQNPNAVSMIRGMIYEQKALDKMLESVKKKTK